MEGGCIWRGRWVVVVCVNNTWDMRGHGQGYGRLWYDFSRRVIISLGSRGKVEWGSGWMGRMRGVDEWVELYTLIN